MRIGNVNFCQLLARVLLVTAQVSPVDRERKGGAQRRDPGVSGAMLFDFSNVRRNHGA